jgi:hypothetical protein
VKILFWKNSRDRMARVLAFTILLGLGCSACSDFSRHRERYLAAVAEARQRLDQAGKSACFRTDWAFGPSLPEDPNVCAHRMEPAGDFVCILAKDLHHAGRYGYAFADPVQSRAQIALGLDIGGCGEWETIEPIEAHWWRLESHLD